MVATFNSGRGLTASDLMGSGHDQNRKGLVRVPGEEARRMSCAKGPGCRLFSEVMTETANDVGWHRDKALVPGYREGAAAYFVKSGPEAAAPPGLEKVRGKDNLFRNPQTGALYEMCETVSGAERFRFLGRHMANMSFGER